MAWKKAMLKNVPTNALIKLKDRDVITYTLNGFDGDNILQGGFSPLILSVPRNTFVKYYKKETPTPCKG